MASNSDPRSSSSASPREPQRDRTPREGASSRRPQRGSASSAARETSRPGTRGRAGSSGGKSFDRRKSIFVLSIVAIAALFLAYVVCVWSPLFQIRRIVVMPTVQVSSAQVSELAAIPAGSTLFGFDESGVEKRLLANPWIKSVRLTRNLPDTLTVEVEERSVAAIVMLSNGQSAWKLSTDGIWLEPVELSVVTADNGVQAYDVQAKDAAAQAGVVYVSEVSAALSPQAGDKCTDAGLLGLIQYIEGFSSALRDQIVSACATSKESIAVVLSNGIKVSLGAPDDIALKEQTVLGILDKFQGQISYINVRTPANPTYRGLTEGTATQDGTAASADALPYQAQAGDATADAAAASSADAATDGSTATSDSDVPSDAAYNGGYYLSDGETWVNYYYEDGNLVHGYYKVDESGNETWVDLG